MTELIRQEEQDSVVNCSKSDNDLEGNNKSILTDTQKLIITISVCKEKYNQDTSTDRFKYVELETFDTFYDEYIEFKKVY